MLTYMEKAVAKKVLRDLRDRDREYREDCEQAYRDGYRPHYCRHGMNLWVDYDPICGPCEDGLTFYQEALYITRLRAQEVSARMDKVHQALNTLREADWSLTRGQQVITLPDGRELGSALIDWAVDGAV